MHSDFSKIIVLIITLCLRVGRQDDRPVDTYQTRTNPQRDRYNQYPQDSNFNPPQAPPPPPLPPIESSYPPYCKDNAAFNAYVQYQCWMQQHVLEMSSGDENDRHILTITTALCHVNTNMFLLFYINTSHALLCAPQTKHTQLNAAIYSHYYASIALCALYKIQITSMFFGNVVKHCH